MESHSRNFKIRLGLFVSVGLALLFIAIFIIGKQQNLFNPVYQLSTTFNNISGLQVGNNVRFSGINVGTVDNISIMNDSTVLVELLIQKDVQKFIKTDSEVSIGSEGLIGDKLIIISQGTPGRAARPGEMLISNEPVETDAIISSLAVTAGYSEIIAQEMADIVIKINTGQGLLGQLIHDSTITRNINATIENLKSSSQGLEENMEAAKNNILLRGYFKKKAREEERQKKKAEEEAKKNEEK
jgi:phospholipid/cholesterol/gamma-HCH transport system substrate-binding protein